MKKETLGYVNSLQSLGTVDGPGVRFVVFMQGCNLRCGICHNPDTHSHKGGKEYTPEEIFKRALRCKEYFGQDGGITVSGGEPLLQAEFCEELFTLCNRDGINTCLDTSGSIINESVLRLLKKTDRVLLDIKYTTEEHYIQHVGTSLAPVLKFLDILEEKGIKTTVRQVIVPSLNDTCESLDRLIGFISSKKCVDKLELLPFKKICRVKYDALKIPFPLGNLPTPTKEEMEKLKKYVKENSRFA